MFQPLNLQLNLETSWLPTTTLPEICSYRREHQSKGEREFRTNWLIPKLIALNTRPHLDGYGNISVTVDDNSSGVLFIAHMDTVHGGDDTKTRQEVQVDKDNILKLKPPKPASIDELNKDPYFNRFGTNYLNHSHDCLGADDGAGIAVMLYLIHKNVPGKYLFTRGEECGCLGIKWMVSHRKSFFDDCDICIEVDRKGVTDIVTEQSTGKCASVAFADDLAKELDMEHKPSDEGIYTDNAHIGHLVPESVNLAAGYYNQHSDRETCDLTYLNKLCKQLAKIDWINMKVYRDLGDFESDVAYGYTRDGFDWVTDDYPTISGAFHDNDWDEVMQWVETNSELVTEYLMLTDTNVEDILNLYNSYNSFGDSK